MAECWRPSRPVRDTSAFFREHPTAVTDRFNVIGALLDDIRYVRDERVPNRACPPVMHYQGHHAEFRSRALQAGNQVFNELTGKADMIGKQYLPDLYRAGYPVIPTVERLQDLEQLPPAVQYVAKPTYGADSVGLQFVEPDQLRGLSFEDLLVQPRVDFDCEVSFDFVDRTLEYALYAPDAEQRWLLEPYEPTQADLSFAQRFIDP